MARIIALEWDTREARIAAGSQRGSDIIVEQALAVALEGNSGELATAEQVGRQLAGVLAEHGLTGSDALLAVPRASIELRTLTLPQAPPEEIPDMVRFQAMQAFTSIGEDWPLDFIELDSHEQSINVLAAVVAPKLVEQMQAVCAASQLKMRCLVLRPFAAISLLHRYEAIDVFRGSLVVDLLPEAADLTAISQGQVVFMRSVRLPVHADPAAQARALVGELRRTIGAAQNQMGSSRIEQIVLCGPAQQHAALRESVADALSLDVITFDPFEAVRHSRQIVLPPAEISGRFAPALGMLACHATGSGHTLDFLNPRKRPAPPSKRRRNLTVAVAVLAVLAILGGWFQVKKSALDAEIADLRQQSFDLEQAVNKARQYVALADRVTEFENGDITWLDEIREVATRMPDADHVILSEIMLGADPQRGGRMTLKGNVTSSDVIAELEESLRYGDNLVRGYYGSIDQTRRDYPYQIETIVNVPPDVLEDGHLLGRPEISVEKTGEKAPAEAPAEAPPEAPAAAPDKPTSPAETSTTPEPATDEDEPAQGDPADATSPQPSTENVQSAGDAMQEAAPAPSESLTP